MTKIAKILPILLLFILIGLAGCFIVSFFFMSEPNILSLYKLSFKIYSGVLIFIDMFPVIQIGAFLFGFSLLFGKIDDENHQSRSEAMITYLKGIFVICILTIGIYIALTEAVKPILEKNLEKQELYTIFYNENKSEAVDSLSSRDLYELEKAEKCIKKAIAIYPESVEAKGILETVKLKKESLKKKDIIEYVETPKTDNLKLSEALDLANNALENKDYFSAHYYASQVVELSGADRSMKDKANQIALTAWELIQTGDNSLEEEDRELYAKKKRAYEKLKNGFLLKAYTDFYNIQYDIEQSGNNQSDLQIEHFLKEIRKKLTAKVYFIEDIEEIPAFVHGKDIEFKITENKRIAYKISAEGVAFGSGKAHEAYLKNATVTKFSYTGKIVWKVKLKYARLIPDISKDNKDIITLQMTGVNSNRKLPDIVPYLVTGNITGDESLAQVLPISFDEFLLIKSASNSIKTIDLASLFKLSRKAEKFALLKKTVITELLTRISEFLLLFVLSLSTCTTAWRYHLTTDDKFKTFWILGLPLFFILAQFFVDASRLLASLTAKLYATTFSNFAIVLYIVTWIVLLIESATRFYLNHKK
ncbi:MAG: hypothetical protein CR988_07990 [Treponema sp.]|nr:MAG: hypothetical protein CR988_07990 [Treponema sp.]